MIIKEYPIGTSLLEISKEYKNEYKHDIILAFVNNV